MAINNFERRCVHGHAFSLFHMEGKLRIRNYEQQKIEILKLQSVIYEHENFETLNKLWDHQRKRRTGRTFFRTKIGDLLSTFISWWSLVQLDLFNCFPMVGSVLSTIFGRFSLVGSLQSDLFSRFSSVGSLRPILFGRLYSASSPSVGFVRSTLFSSDRAETWATSSLSSFA